MFDDAEIENTIEATLRGGFFNQGENCTAVTRLLLHENIYDKFLSAFIKRVKKIRMGDPSTGFCFTMMQTSPTGMGFPNI